MDLITHKVLTMVLTGVIPLLFGLIPWKIGRRYCKPDNVRHQRIVSILLCYGGGILLGLSLLHLLPEVSLSTLKIFAILTCTIFEPPLFEPIIFPG